MKYGRLLRPGQTVDHVLTAEKRREENIRRCGWWIGRWTEAELANIDQFRASVLGTLRNGRHK